MPGVLSIEHKEVRRILNEYIPAKYGIRGAGRSICLLATGTISSGNLCLL